MKRVVSFILLLLAALGIAAAVFLAWNRIPTRLQPAVKVNPVPADAQAAIQGTAAMYTIDYQEPQGAWLARVCAVSTEQGCQFATGYISQTIQAAADKYKIQTGCAVLPVAAVDALPDGSRVWQLSVHLEHPWPAVQADQDVYALVAQNESGAWKFERLLFTQEAAKYEGGSK